MIDVTLIGTSALVPLPDRALTAMQLVCGGHSILFDCGEGTQSAARKAGASLMTTDIIALTHYHGDHIFGLPGLLQTMNSMGRTEKLTIIGPEGIEKELAPIMQLAGWMPYGVELKVIPSEGVELNRISKGWPDGARLIPVKTEHRVISQGYVFALPRAGKFDPQQAKALGIPTKEWGKLQKGQTVTVDGREFRPDQVMGPARKGLKVVFTGDTCRCAALVEAAKNADLLISEATYGENEQLQRAIDHGHMNFAQAGALAKEACVKRLWLVHFSQMMEDPAEFLGNAAAEFPEAECGFDGKRITLHFEK